MYLEIKTKLDEAIERHAFDQEIDFLKEDLSWYKSLLIQNKIEKKEVEATLEQIMTYYNLYISIFEWTYYFINILNNSIILSLDLLYVLVHVAIPLQAWGFYLAGRIDLRLLSILFSMNFFTEILNPLFQEIILKETEDIKKIVNNAKDHFENQKNNIYDEMLLSINKSIESNELKIFNLESKLKELEVPLQELQELTSLT